MGVQEQLDRLKSDIDSAYTAVWEKGGEVPEEGGSASLAEAVRSIPAGSTGGEVYSTEETQIGRWINGEPLYRKVIEIYRLQSSSNNIFYVDDAIEGINSVVRIDAQVVRMPTAGSPTTFNVWSMNGLINVFLEYRGSGGVLAYSNTDTSTGASYYMSVILEYTKLSR